MFLETAIALSILWFGIGWFACELLRTQSANRRSDTERSRRIRAQAFLQVAREEKHLGTPYIREATTTLMTDQFPPSPEVIATVAALQLHAADNDNWSRNADARIVSLPAPRVQTGRPA